MTAGPSGTEAIFGAWLHFLKRTMGRPSGLERDERGKVCPSMADVHVPNLEESAPARPAGRRGGHDFGRILLEVVMISLGVFLGLAGEQWRESAHHRELARSSLRSFRAEMMSNRKAVEAVKDYHVVTRESLRKYLAAGERARKDMAFQLAGFQPATFEHAAWDLALATQSLSDVDSDVALALSHVYTLQQTYTAATSAFLSAMYINSKDSEAFLRALQVYYGDILVYEPRLLQMYGELLPKIDAALGER